MKKFLSIILGCLNFNKGATKQNSNTVAVSIELPVRPETVLGIVKPTDFSSSHEADLGPIKRAAKSYLAKSPTISLISPKKALVPLNSRPGSQVYRVIRIQNGWVDVKRPKHPNGQVRHLVLG